MDISKKMCIVTWLVVAAILLAAAAPVLAAREHVGRETGVELSTVAQEPQPTPVAGQYAETTPTSLVASQPVTTTGVPGNENWASGFNRPGANNSITSLVADPFGNVYAGGYFTEIGNVEANYAAKWNGSTWSKLGAGTNDRIFAMAVDHAGRLFTAGPFTSAGGVPANHIAMWDGVAWSSLGSGFDYSAQVRDMIVDQSNKLVVAGYFSDAGGQPVSNIARWDGTSWSRVGSGCCNAVGALAIDGAGNLYAADWGVHKWDGAAWSTVGPKMNGEITSLAIGQDGTIYAGGAFTSVGGTIVNHIARWNGSSWFPFGTGLQGDIPTVTDMAIDHAGNLYIGGSFTSVDGHVANSVARWNGQNWSNLDGGVVGLVNTVAALAIDHDDGLYVGGQFPIAGAVAANNIAEWKDATWSSPGGGAGVGDGEWSGPLASTIDAAGNLYVGGRFDAAGTVPASNVAKWNGIGWSALGQGVNGLVQALATDQSGNMYAGGQFTTAGGMNSNHIAKWNGSAWQPLASGMNEAVVSLAADTFGNVYAGGWFTQAGNVTTNYIAKWNGSTWSALGSGLNGGATTLAVDQAGNVYAAGYFTMAGGAPADHIAKWNGTNWSPLGSGLTFNSNGSVNDLVFDKLGRLFAGGLFSLPDGSKNIAVWDGSHWSGIPARLDSYASVRALAIDGAGLLYAGGTFGTIAGVPVGYIAAWDGSHWRALGDGIFGIFPQTYVNSLAVDPASNLYVSGTFKEAGRKRSSNHTRWTAADGKCGLTAGSSHTLYAGNLPLTVQVTAKGTLDCITVQRFDRSHPLAPPGAQTGYYWDIKGWDANGNPAAGYAVNLTLSATFATDADDVLCRHAGLNWQCAASGHDSVNRTVTLNGVAQLSEWAVGDPQLGPLTSKTIMLPLVLRRR